MLETSYVDLYRQHLLYGQISGFPRHNSSDHWPSWLKNHPFRLLGLERFIAHKWIASDGK